MVYAKAHVLGAINADKSDVTSQNKQESLKEKTKSI